MSTTACFPLITLRPVADSSNVWTALLLSADTPLDGPSLLRLLDEHGLRELLDTLPCIVDAAAAPDDLPPDSAQRLVFSQADDSGCLQGFGTLVHVPAVGAEAVIKGDSSSRGLLLGLLSLVSADADSNAIENLIKHDPHLSYQLLKLVNSVAFAPGKHIDSFGQAIVLLGRRQLQRWLQLLLYSRPAGSATASPLLPRAAMRANLMESLARRIGLSKERQDHAFMIGMFSLLDVLFGLPLEEIVTPLNLADEVVAGLLQGEGTLGQLLVIVLAGEEAPAMPLAAALAGAGIKASDWAALSIAAIRWTAQVAGEA